jgi:hypothetical protein
VGPVASVHCDLEELTAADESLAAALRRISGAALFDKLIRLVQTGG